MRWPRAVAVAAAAAAGALLAAPAAGVMVAPKRAPLAFLGRLPDDAAMYFTVRADGLARAAFLLPAAWGGDDVRGWIAAIAGTPVADAAALEGLVATGLGIDPTRPIVAAGMSADEPAARKAMERILAALRAKARPGAVAAAAHKAGALAMHGRVVVPLAAGASVETFVEGLRRLSRGEIAACPVGPKCTGGATAKLKALGAAFYAPLERGAVVITPAALGAEVVVDVVLGVFEAPPPAAIVARIAAVEKTVGAGGGGPGPGLRACAALSEAAAWSVCVDPRRVAEYGAVEGWSLSVRAVGSVDPTMVGALLEAGFAEADRSLAILRASGGIVAGFGASVRAESGGIAAAVRWTTTDAGRDRLAAVLGPGLRTRDDAELAHLLLRPLRGRFPRGAPPFDSEDGAVRAVREGGLPAALVVLAQAWPELLATPGVDAWIDRLVDPGGHPPSPPWTWRLDGDALLGEAILRAR